MWILWLLALVPAITGAVFYVRSREIRFWEWMAATGAGILCCLLFQWTATASMTADEEVWSGQISLARFDPSYVEWYMQAHTRTVGSGKNQRTEVYFTRETRRVPDRWSASDTLDQSRSIPAAFFERVAVDFKCREQRKGLKGNYDSGDPFTYVAENRTGFIHPTTATRYFENRVKAAPSLFSFRRVPEGTKGLYEYPYPQDWLSPSGRLRGRAVAFGDMAFDQVNARLGPTVYANLVAVGFGPEATREQALLQEARWVGGKKNDLVLCFGGGEGARPSWSYVFGWTEKAVVKRQLESLLLSEPIGPGLLPKIEEEVRRDYRIKDWSKFDYLTVEPPAWSYAVLVVVMVLTQAFVWTTFLRNDLKKENP